MIFAIGRAMFGRNATASEIEQAREWAELAIDNYSAMIYEYGDVNIGMNRISFHRGAISQASAHMEGCLRQTGTVKWVLVERIIKRVPFMMQMAELANVRHGGTITLDTIDR